MGKLKNYEIDALTSKAVKAIQTAFKPKTIADIADTITRKMLEADIARAKDIVKITGPLLKELKKISKNVESVCECGYMLNFCGDHTPERIDEIIAENLFEEQRVYESDVKDEIIIRNMGTELDAEQLIKELVAKFA